MTRRYDCPKCNKNDGVDIVYGMPSPELAEQAEKGLIALGGCIVEENQPVYRCLDCGYEWDRAEHFEACKQRWLKEHVKGRSWAEMMDDRDREIDEKAKAIMTPEYIAMWGKTNKDGNE